MAFLWYDLRDAARALVRSRGYSLVVVLTLGLGIGVNTAIFTIVDALLFKPLPYPDGERIVRVAEWPRTGGNYTMSPAAYLDWRDRVRAFSRFEARVGASFALLDGGDAEEIRGARVTAGYFDLLGMKVARGRPFTAEDARPGQPCVAVISEPLWTRRLAAAPERIGGPLRFSGRTCTLIGVLPAGSVPDRAAPEIYVPLSWSGADAQDGGRRLTVLARLAPGVSIDDARRELVAIAQTYNAARGDAGRGWTVALTPMRDAIVGVEPRRLATVLFGAVTIVLVVACLNVAGLSLSRAAGRRREIAIRTALGASRGRVFRYLMVEHVLLAAAGGLVGILLGSWVLRAFIALAPAGLLPTEVAASLDGRALLFTAVVSMTTSVLFGIAPAWRSTAEGPGDALATGSRAAGPSRVTASLHGTLLVVEVSLAMVLVIAAVSLVVSFARLVRVDPGFAGEQVLTFRLSLPPERYPTSDTAVGFFDAALSALRRAPGVTDAGAATSLPLGGWLFGTTFAVHGGMSDPDRPSSAHIQHVTDGYFDALGIPVVDGRAFTPDDGAQARPVAMVNETFVRRFAGEGRAVGKQLRLGLTTPRGREALWEIVGVIRTVKTGGLAEADLATPEIYVPYAQSPMPAMFVAVRAGGGAWRTVPDLRAAIRSVDAELPMGAVLSMDERLGTSVRRERFRTIMIGSSAVLAIFLACLGVYAVRSQAVAARIREMGIRLALGATRPQLLTMVLRQGMKHVALGLAVGVVGAVWVRRFVDPWLFETRTGDPAVIAGAAVLFGAVALLAGWLPARRASTVDPLTLLRQE